MNGKRLKKHMVMCGDAYNSLKNQYIFDEVIFFFFLRNTYFYRVDGFSMFSSLSGYILTVRVAETLLTLEVLRRDNIFNTRFVIIFVFKCHRAS